MRCPQCNVFNWRHPSIIAAIVVVMAVVMFAAIKLIFMSRVGLMPRGQHAVEPLHTALALRAAAVEPNAPRLT